MKQKYKKKPSLFRRIGKERINILFNQAQKRFKKNPELSHRYVEIARKIAMKYKIQMKREHKRMFCKHCYKFLMPGINSRVRNNNGKMVYYCKNCRKYMRFPLK